MKLKIALVTLLIAVCWPPLSLQATTAKSQATDYAVAFDGTSSLKPSGVIPPFGATFTISGWVLPALESTGVRTIAAWATLTSGNVGNFFRIEGDDNLFYGQWNGSFKKARSKTRLEFGKWQHVAFVKDNNTIRFFINGVESEAIYTNGTAPMNNNSESDGFRFGGIYQNGVFKEAFVGEMNNLAFYTSARSSQQIVSEFTNGVNTSEGTLWGYWDFDEMSSIIGDKSGKGNTLEIDGNVSFTEGKEPEVQMIHLTRSIERYTKYTTTDYPVIGTFAETSWNVLQEILAEARAYEAAGVVVVAEIVELIDRLNLAAENLEKQVVLPRLLVTAKAMTPNLYPIGNGHIMGTYPQAKWDALQAAIVAVEAFVVQTTVTEEAIETHRSWLQATIDDLNGSMVLPFKVSNDTNEYWYQVRDQRTEPNYWFLGELMKSEELTYPIALLISPVNDNTLDEQLFKFEKAPDPSKGYYIYNKIIEDAPLTGTEFTNAMVVDLDSVPSTWQFGKTSSPTHFTVFREGQINLQLNSYVGADNPYVGFYYPGAGINDFGNNWEFVEVLAVGQTDFTALKALVATALSFNAEDYPLGEGENMYSSEKWAVFVAIRQAAIDVIARESSGNIPSQTEVDATIEALQQAMDELKASQKPPVLLSDNVATYWYMLRDYRATPSWWKIDSVGDMANRLAMVKSVTMPQASDSLLFKFVRAEEPFTGLYVYSKLDEKNALAADLEGNFITFGADYTPSPILYSASNKQNFYLLSLEESGRQLNSYAGYSPPFIAFYDGGMADAGNNWSFVPAPVPTSVEKPVVNMPSIFVADRRVISSDSSLKLMVYSLSGQKQDAYKQLVPGIYIVRIVGLPQAFKVIVN